MGWERQTPCLEEGARPGRGPGLRCSCPLSIKGTESDGMLIVEYRLSKDEFMSFTSASKSTSSSVRQERGPRVIGTIQVAYK